MNQSIWNSFWVQAMTVRICSKIKRNALWSNNWSGLDTGNAMLCRMLRIIFDQTTLGANIVTVLQMVRAFLCIFLCFYCISWLYVSIQTFQRLSYLHPSYCGLFAFDVFFFSSFLGFVGCFWCTSVRFCEYTHICTYVQKTNDKFK